jgi:phthalate 4,5-dioxygenase oxygenase subunit
MLTKANNDRLTKVTADAPMARLMRERCWVPFLRDAALIVGVPQRVRLFGEDFVAFRAEDGRVGFVDERCPHRGVSLALARVEGCTLRCIFHGWRIDVTGAVVEVPSAGASSAEFAARIEFNHYPTREAGGLIWVYLGKKVVPEFPKLPFMDVPPECRVSTRSTVPCNWLQGLEAGLDSSHLGWLHQSWVGDVRTPDAARFTVSPVYETKDTSYGMRAAAIRDLPDGNSFVRICEYVLPFTVMNQTDRPVTEGREYACFMAIPVDNETHLLFWCIWNQGAPLADVSSFSKRACDYNNYATFRGTRENNWGQDRAAMRAGHFSGFTENLLEEDVVVQISMGAVADRTREHVCATDVAIVKARLQLLKLLKTFEAGESVESILVGYRTDGTLPVSAVVTKGFDWVNGTIAAVA